MKSLYCLYIVNKMLDMIRQSMNTYLCKNLQNIHVIGTITFLTFHVSEMEIYIHYGKTAFKIMYCVEIC